MKFEGQSCTCVTQRLSQKYQPLYKSFLFFKGIFFLAAASMLLSVLARGSGCPLFCKRFAQMFLAKKADEKCLFRLILSFHPLTPNTKRHQGIRSSNRLALIVMAAATFEVFVFSAVNRRTSFSAFHPRKWPLLFCRLGLGTAVQPLGLLFS
jgi:hypothetical protein